MDVFMNEVRSTGDDGRPPGPAGRGQTAAARLRPVPAEPRELRSAYGRFPSGVVALCGLRGGVPTGLAASSFTSVSLDPPLVSVCMQNVSTTWPLLRTLPRLGISLLAADQDLVCARLSAKGGHRFADVGWTAGDSGAVFIAGAAAWLECERESEVSAGDHIIVLLRVEAIRVEHEREPLVFHGSRFRQLLGDTT